MKVSLAIVCTIVPLLLVLFYSDATIPASRRTIMRSINAGEPVPPDSVSARKTIMKSDVGEPEPPDSAQALALARALTEATSGENVIICDTQSAFYPGSTCTSPTKCKHFCDLEYGSKSTDAKCGYIDNSCICYYRCSSRVLN